MKTEQDPLGKSSKEPGAKLDAGKPLVALVLGDFSRALLAISEVGTFGADKYSPHGWLSVPHGEDRYEDAKLRHLLYRHSGELIDQDSGLLHAAHEVWNALASLELYLRRTGDMGDMGGVAPETYLRDFFRKVPLNKVVTPVPVEFPHFNEEESE